MSSDKIDVATVEAAVFEGYVDSVFNLQIGDEAVEIVLKKVESSSPAGAVNDEARIPFALVFQCETTSLPAGVYSLTHLSGPACDLFLSPFAGGENWCQLEAVFN